MEAAARGRTPTGQALLTSACVDSSEADEFSDDFVDDWSDDVPEATATQRLLVQAMDRATHGSDDDDPADAPPPPAPLLPKPKKAPKPPQREGDCVGGVFAGFGLFEADNEASSGAEERILCAASATLGVYVILASKNRRPFI